METMGIGGVLSFDEGAGVAAMERASAAFGHMEHSSNKFEVALEGAGERFKMFAEMVGVGAIFGMGGLLHEAIATKSEFEGMNITIGSTLAMVKHMGLADAMKEAANQASILEEMAMDTNAQARDLMGVYTQILGPAVNLGQSLEQVQNMTKGAVLGAKSLGLAYDQVGFGLSKAISGTLNQHDLMYRSLHSKGLIKEDAGSFNALPAEERLKRINGWMDKFRELSVYSANTWEALTSSMKDMVQLLLAGSGSDDIKKGFITPLFTAIKADLAEITGLFRKNKAGASEYAYSLGEYLVPAYNIFRDAIKQVVEWGVTLKDTLFDLSVRYKAIKDQVVGLFTPERIGMMRKAEVSFMAIALAVTLLAPAFAALQFVAGPVMAILGGAATLLEALPGILIAVGSALAGPLGAALGTVGILFLMFRKNGEDIGDTFHRLVYDVLLPAWEGFSEAFMASTDEMMAPLMDSWETLKTTFQFVMDYLSDSFDTNATKSKSFGTTAGNVFAAIAVSITTVIGWLGKLAAFAVYVGANIRYAFEVAGQRIGESMGMVFIAMKNTMTWVFNAMTAPIRALLDVMLDMLETINATSIGRAALAEAGVSQEDSVQFANKVQALIETGPLSKGNLSEIPGYGALPESPEEEAMRKQLARMDAASKNKTAAALEFPPFEVVVEDKRQLDVHACAQIDGKEVAMATTRHQLELKERAGATASPWQRRAAVQRATVLK